MYSELCEIVQNKQLAENVFEMVLKSEHIATAASPGQFLHMKINSGMAPLLRRPISINCLNKDNGTVSIVYHVIGQGTEELSKAKTGSTIDVMGPLGKGFPVLADKNCAVVGGGMGTAPLLELVRNLESVDAYLGFRNTVYKVHDFEQSCRSVCVATEDGSFGYKGYVTERLEQNINKYDVVYTCGPKKMMQRVMEICREHDVECYVSIEERMGCGIGACLVCACKVQEQTGEWHYKKACKDGPVFNAKEVLLDE